MLDLPTEKQIAYLLGELCSQLGFCSLPPDRYESLVSNPPADGDDFTDAVFKAEGLDPDSDPALWRQARELVGKTFKRYSGARLG